MYKNQPAIRLLLCTAGAALAFLPSSSGLPAAAQMGASQAASAAHSQGEDDALSRLNNEFRNKYKEAKDHCAQQTLPLIMCIGDHMVLIDKDVREQEVIIPPLYTELKVVDHIPLALYVLLDRHCGKPLDKEALDALNRIKNLISPARHAIDTLGLDPATLDRQHKLIDRSVLFLEQTANKGTISSKELTDFCRDLEPMVMENVDQAVAAQLQLVDKAVSAWREKLGAERFSKLTVVIVSGHMPRQKNTCFQYFSQLLNVKEEGLRIVYSEGLDTEEAARDMVGTHVLDASIGETFFKEKLRMHRDLLSDGAQRYLKAHPPLSGKH